LLLELERVAGDGDVVIGGEESDQAEDQAAAGLDGTEAIEAGPGALEIGEVWRSWGLLAVREGARGVWSDRGHGAEEATGSAGLPLLCSTPGNTGLPTGAPATLQTQGRGSSAEHGRASKLSL
jgi:hypothetical protein